MAHFAKLDETNKVLEVIVVDNKDLLDDTGNEKEEVGIAFLKGIFGEDTSWKQTSFNGSFRGIYARVDGYYVPSIDKFTFVKEFASWTLDEETLRWEAPTPMPILKAGDDGHGTHYYKWNESTKVWVKTPTGELPEEE